MDSTPRSLAHSDDAVPRRPPGPFLLVPDRPAIVASSMACADHRISWVASSRERPATSVSQTRASMPVASFGWRPRDDAPRQLTFGCRGASASSIHLMARPCRRASCDRSSGSASKDSRSIVRACGSVDTTIFVRASIAGSSRAATSSGASAGTRLEGGLWVCRDQEGARLGKYRYVVVREIDAASAAASTVGTAPLAAIS